MAKATNIRIGKDGKVTTGGDMSPIKGALIIIALFGMGSGLAHYHKGEIPNPSNPGPVTSYEVQHTGGLSSTNCKHGKGLLGLCK